MVVKGLNYSAKILSFPGSIYTLGHNTERFCVMVTEGLWVLTACSRLRDSSTALFTSSRFLCAAYTQRQAINKKLSQSMFNLLVMKFDLLKTTHSQSWTVMQQ